MLIGTAFVVKRDDFGTVFHVRTGNIQAALGVSPVDDLLAVQSPPLVAVLVVWSHADPPSWEYGSKRPTGHGTPLDANATQQGSLCFVGMQNSSALRSAVSGLQINFHSLLIEIYN